MPKTVNGIYNNIYESTYKINKFGLEFYFSSQFYANKFYNEVQNFIDEEKMKLYNKYKLILLADKFFAIVYYIKLEKRGFYIKENGKDISKNTVYTIEEFKT